MTAPSMTAKSVVPRRRRTGDRTRKATGRTLPHVGEWKVELRGHTRNDLFQRVAPLIAFTAGRTSEPPTAWEQVALSARDEVALLVDWANELIGRSEASGAAYTDVRNLEVAPPVEHAGDPWRLTAEVCGRPVAEWRSALKAATYHGAMVERDRGGWRGTLLFDI